MAVQLDPAIAAVFVLAALGVAVASLYAPTAGTAALWVAALVPWAGILLWRAPAQPWLPAVTAGLLAGLATGAVQSLLQDVLLAHHPADAAALAGQTRAAVALRLTGVAVAAGGAWGLLAGALAWAVRRVA